MRPQEAQSTAFKPLPVARGNPRQPSLVLFYAYREPAWTAAEHSRALKTFIKLCEAHDLKGRGRCAPEGVNCTLTGGQQQIRSFCTALREWDAQQPVAALRTRLGPHVADTALRGSGAGCGPAGGGCPGDHCQP